MPVSDGSVLDDLDSPQLLIDLDQLDANLARMQRGCRERGLALCVHFKSLKCGSLARYLAARGVERFLCAKLNEAEVLADAGIAEGRRGSKDMLEVWNKKAGRGGARRPAKAK